MSCSNSGGLPGGCDSARNAEQTKLITTAQPRIIAERTHATGQHVFHYLTTSVRPGGLTEQVREGTELPWSQSGQDMGVNTYGGLITPSFLAQGFSLRKRRLSRSCGKCAGSWNGTLEYETAKPKGTGAVPTWPPAGTSFTEDPFDSSKILINLGGGKPEYAAYTGSGSDPDMVLLEGGGTNVYTNPFTGRGMSAPIELRVLVQVFEKLKEKACSRALNIARDNCRRPNPGCDCVNTTCSASGVYAGFTVNTEAVDPWYVRYYDAFAGKAPRVVVTGYTHTFNMTATVYGDCPFTGRETHPRGPFA